MDKHSSICTHPDFPEKIANPGKVFFNGFRSASQACHIRFTAGIQRVASVNAPLRSGAPPPRMRREMRAKCGATLPIRYGPWEITLKKV